MIDAPRRVNIRAERLAALGDPARLAIADELTRSDRSPGELQRRLDMSSNLLAHHLDVLESVGLIRRAPSSGDRRRRYVRLVRSSLGGLLPDTAGPAEPALFVCSHNSARSQLAAALWRSLTGAPADSAGTHPARRVHPGAIAAAERAGIDLAEARPRSIEELSELPELVVTVCDQAHEELEPGEHWLHWSLADPVAAGSRRAFDRTVAELSERITAHITAPPTPTRGLR